MKIKLINYTAILILFMIVSCEKNDEILDNSTTSIAKSNNNFPNAVEVVDGRLVFETKKDFQENLNYLLRNDLSNDQLNQLFESYYSNGLTPLYPQFPIQDEQKLQESLNQRLEFTPDNRIDSTKIELTDELVPINEFASLLNAKREIVINDKLYVYTYSGLFIADIEREQNLYEYLNNNSIYDEAPNPFELQTGLNTIERGINKYVSDNISEFNPSCDSSLNPVLDPLDNNTTAPPISNPGVPMLCEANDYDPFTPPSGGGGDSGSEDYTVELIEYMNQLDECAQINVWTPFGTIIKCFDYFPNGKRRTKTKYEHIDLAVPELGDALQSITVKVKHQKEYLSWSPFPFWGAVETDEVALVINQATFLIDPPSLGVPMSNFNYPQDDGTSNAIYYIGENGYNYNPNSSIAYTSGASLPDLTPITPFDEDVIVQVFDNTIPQIDFSVTAEDINETYWDLLHGKAKSIFKQLSGYDPEKITTVYHTNDQILLHHVNISKRQENTKKIVDNLYFDLAANFVVTISVDEWNNSIITNPTDLSEENSGGSNDILSYSVEKQSLADFDKILVDFDGLTRRSDKWRGSKIIYEMTSD